MQATTDSSGIIYLESSEWQSRIIVGVASNLGCIVPTYYKGSAKWRLFCSDLSGNRMVSQALNLTVWYV